MKIGITGATGQLGQLVVEKLKALVPAADIVALVRNTEKAASLGVTAKTFDYTQPETLAPALEGIDKLLLISSSDVGQRVPQHQNVINAAKAANVKSIAYTSLLNADQSTLSLAPEHKETEALIKNSGIPYVLLRNGWYTENYTGNIQQVLQSETVLTAAENGKIAAATRADFAEAAAKALVQNYTDNKVFELAGDESFTMEEYAQAISEVSGKKINFQNLPVATYATTLEEFGVPNMYATMLASIDGEVAKGQLDSQSSDLHQLLGRPTTSLKDAVTVALKANV